MHWPTLLHILFTCSPTSWPFRNFQVSRVPGIKAHRGGAVSRLVFKSEPGGRGRQDITSWGSSRSLRHEGTPAICSLGPGQVSPGLENKIKQLSGKGDCRADHTSGLSLTSAQQNQ